MRAAEDPDLDRFLCAVAESLGEKRVSRDGAGSGLALQPAAVLWPHSASAVSKVLRAARVHKVAVVACGTGSRLPGMLAAMAAGRFVLLSLRDLAGVHRVEPEALWLEAGAGTPLADVQRAAQRVGCALAGFEDAEPGSVGGWLGRAEGLPDPILGLVQPAVLGLEAVLPSGEIVSSVPTPRSACGPDAFASLVGTGGVFGVITRAILKLSPEGGQRRTLALSFARLESACAWARGVHGSTYPPRRAELWVDRVFGQEPPTFRAVALFAGHEQLVEASLRYCGRKGGELEGTPLPESPAWEKGASPAGELAHGWIRWSRLGPALGALDGRIGVPSRVVVDRLSPMGGRLRVFSVQPDPAGEVRSDSQRELDDLLAELDPQMQASGACWQAFSRLKVALDPDGLINPQAWPLGPRPTGDRGGGR